MPKRILVFIYFIIVSANISAQQNRLLPISEKSYDYINRLQSRGLLLELDPTTQPYTFLEIEQALSLIDDNTINELESIWIKYIKNRINFDAGSMMGIEITGSLRLSDSKRLNTLEPLRDNIFVYANPSFLGYFESGYVIAQANIQHDYYYDQDPDGIDSARRLYFRNQESYLGFQNDFTKIYLGRFDNNWAVRDRSSTILSDNARSFDQLNMSFHKKWFSFQSITGELDGLNQNGTFNGVAFGEGSIKRYIALHRLNWNPAKNFRFSLFESIIYTGESAGLSLKYMNPFNVFGFLSDNYSKNEDVNLMLGSLFWWQFKKITLEGQFLLDDIHVEDKDEVTTFSLFGSMNVSDVLSISDVGIEMEAVAYQTYNAPEAEERYLYLGRGIATQNTDYVLTKIYSKFYLDEWVNGLAITPSLTYYLQGEQIINQPIVRTNPDGSLIDIILTGEVEKTLRVGINIFYNPHPNFWFELNTGFNKVDNYMNVSRNTNNRFSTIAKIGFRWGLYSRD